MGRNRIIAGVSLVFVLGSAYSAVACGASEVCSDVSSSLAGQITIDLVTLTWSTDSENSSVTSYVIRRYNCGDPATCSTYVGTVTASGTCNVTQPYTFNNTPPAPVSQWTYTVEVWKSDGSRACAGDVVPQ